MNRSPAELKTAAAATMFERKYMFFKKTKEKLMSMLDAYLQEAGSCFSYFKQSMEEYLEKNDPRGTDFYELLQKTHISESLADDKRTEFELMLYKTSRLLPGSRSDILDILNSFDRIPNKAETVLFSIHCQNIMLPEDMKGDIRKLTDINTEACAVTTQAFVEFFEPPDELHTNEYVEKIDEYESTSDRIERTIIINIFDRQDIGFGEKMLLKELVLNIGTISDRCEIVGNLIMIHSIKKVL